MTTPIPFPQVQSSFQDQLNQFDTYAQHGFPLGQLINTSAPTTNSNVPGNGCAWYDLACQTRAGVGAAASAAGKTMFAGLSITRITAFLLGLLAIGGALFLFKPTQEIVRGTVKGAME